MAYRRARQSAADVGEAPEVTAALSLEDPTAKPVQDTLDTLLHAHTAGVVDSFLHRWLPAVLSPRPDHPIEVPELARLKPVVRACEAGQNGEAWDTSPAWRALFGANDATAQDYIRAIWHSVRAFHHPAPGRHDLFVQLLAERIRAVFEAAAELQRQRQAKHDAQRSPVARAQAAAALLEALPAFQSALGQFVEATRDGPVVRFAEVLQILPRVERVAKECLS